MTPKSFKKNLFYILEAYENEDINPYLHWARWFDAFMLCMIFLNLVCFVLETVEDVNNNWRLFFVIFEKISIVLFTIEYFLRIWTITESKKYRHPLRGRIRYAFTPLALIDLLAFLPSYIPLISNDFLFIRIFRLLRLFRIFKLWRHSLSLRMLTKIILTKRADLQVVFFTIILIILIASSMMYLIEHDNQPTVFSNIPKTMWWAVMTLTTVGYGDVYPVTALGKILAALIAILGIALFAVPAGIISAGFMNEIELANRSEKIELNANRIEKAFYLNHSFNGISITRRLIDLITLKSRLQLSEQDIFDAIQRKKGYRIRYKQNTKDDRFSSAMVIEHFDYNRSYGSYINRAANIAIVSPMSYAEHSIGHFTAHLAKYISADYISNEMYGESDDINAEFAFSFTQNAAFLDDEPQHAPFAFLEFKNDIQNVIRKDEIVLIIHSYKSSKADFVYHFGGKKDEQQFKFENSTFKEADKLENFYHTLMDNFNKNGHNFSSALHLSLDNQMKDSLEDSLHQFIWRYTGANVLSLYMNDDLIEWSNNELYFEMIEIVGDTIKEIFHAEKRKEEKA